MKRNRNIGIVVPEFPVPSETFIVTKVLGLLERGYDVQLFTTRPSRYWDRFGNLNGREDVRGRIHISVFRYRQDPVRLFGYAFWRLLITAIRHPVGLVLLIAYQRRESGITKLNVLMQVLHKLMFVGKEIDILHIEFDAQAFGMAGLKTFLGCRLVLSARGAVSGTTVTTTHPGFYHYIFSHVDHYHFISAYLHKELMAAGMPEHIPFTIIEPAIDLILFQPGERQHPEQQLVLISVGRLTWVKGIEFAIDAVAEVVRQGYTVRYLVVGGGEYEVAGRFAAHQHGLLETGAVQFIGAVAREKVKEYFQDADMMIHPALQEGFCNAVIEGQAMELPVICSDAGGLPENIENEVTGFVTPKRDSREMARKIIELIDHPELRTKMGKAGRRRAVEKYDIQKLIDRFEILYDSL